jgi:nitroreductase
VHPFTQPRITSRKAIMSEVAVGLFEAIYTQRAIRRFRPEPVPRDMLVQVLEAATKAPSGGNSQPWAFVVIDQPEQLAAAAEIARAKFAPMYEGALARQQPGDAPPMPNLKRMIDEVDNIPAWIVVCSAPPSKLPADPQLGSIYPAIQNLLLAARGLGLGAVLTLLLGGPQLPHTKALLELPDYIEPVAFIPIGFPADGVHYGPTTRRPVAEVVHWGRWDNDRENTAKIAYRSGP